MENSEDIQIQVPTSMSSFIIKLWNMVCNPNSDDIITWSISGNSFVIKDQIIFYTSLLPMYYKHNNMTSFIRQLNLYGFHKIPNADNHVIEFYHPFFQKDEPKLLLQIKRKTPLSKCKSDTPEKPSEDIQKALSEVKLIKEKQDSVDNQLAQLQQENSAMWYELNELRVRHKKQSKIVNKLVQFLVNFIQPKLKDVHNSKPHSSNGGATIFEVDGEVGASDYWKQIDEKMIEDKSGKLSYENKMIKDETKKTEAPRNKERSLSVINNSNPVRILNEICNMTKASTVYHSGESKPKKIKLASSSKTHNSKQLSISNSADNLLEMLEQSLQDSVENDDHSIIYPDPNFDSGNICPAIDYKKPNQRKKLEEACGSKLPKITSHIKEDVATVIDDPVSRDIQNDTKSKKIKKVSKSSSKNHGKVTVGTSASTLDVLDNVADISASNEAVDITANEDCPESQKLLTEELSDVINVPVNSDALPSDEISTLFAASQNNPIILTLPENHELQNYLPQKQKVPITAQQLGLHVESTESDLNNLKDFLSTYDIDPDAVLEMLTSDSNSEQTLNDGTLIKVEPTSSKQNTDSETDLLTCTADEAGAHNLEYIDASFLFDNNYEPHQSAGTNNLSKKSLISRKKNLQ